MAADLEIAVYRKRLQGMMKGLQGKFAQLRDEVSGAGEVNDTLSASTLDIADQGSHEFEETVTLGLADNEHLLMEEIDDALARIEEGKFGRCENCGKAISKERLHALPYSRHCVHCMINGEKSGFGLPSCRHGTSIRRQALRRSLSSVDDSVA